LLNLKRRTLSDMRESRAGMTPSYSGGPALRGVRIVDLTWVLAGPLTTQLLGQHGAEVIRVESQTRVDVTRRSSPYAQDIPGLNRSGYFSCYNANKRSLSLNLNTSEGRNLLKRLVSTADVLVENYTPKALKHWNLTFEDLVRTTPDLVMLSLSAHGQTGPRALHPAIGYSITGLVGMAHLTGWPDRYPLLPHAAYTDYVVPAFAVTALLAALDYRRRTGRGFHLDISQTEIGATLVAPMTMEEPQAGQRHTRAGNCDGRYAPHGAYRCQGDERWCVISVRSDKEWRSLCAVLGMRSEAEDPRFATMQDRLSHRAELDERIDQETLRFNAEALMSRLQHEGVPCGIVQSVRDLHEDPQLAYRRHYELLEHPEMGLSYYDRPGFRLSATPAVIRPAPCFAEANEYACKELIGLSDDEIADLVAGGVLE